MRTPATRAPLLEARTLLGALLALLLVTRMLLGTKGIATRNKGHATSNKGPWFTVGLRWSLHTPAAAPPCSVKAKQRGPRPWHFLKE